jgi:hypothetical protein
MMRCETKHISHLNEINLVISSDKLNEIVAFQYDGYWNVEQINTKI